MKTKHFKPFVFVACLVPASGIVWQAFTHQLGANPIETITHETGLWTLILLLVTLSITPLRKISGMYSLIQFRRMIGLFAFFYGTLHLMTYVWLDQFFDVHAMLKDIYKRPFITAGMTGFALMIPLALTSTKGWIRRLGRNWQRLHRLIYFSAAAGVIHFLWLVKRDKREPEIYGAILSILLLWRIGTWIMDHRRAHKAVPRPGSLPGSAPSFD